jgi:hypothetical protein
MKSALAAVFLAFMMGYAVAASSKLSEPVISGGYSWGFTQFANGVLYVFPEKKLIANAPAADWEAASVAAGIALRRDNPRCNLDFKQFPKDGQGWDFWFLCD